MSLLNALYTTSSPSVAPPLASRMTQSESLRPSAHSSALAPRVTARMNASSFAAVFKFSGTEDDENRVVHRMDQYEAFVKVSLKSGVGLAEDLIDASLMQFFLYGLKDEAIVFDTKLMSGLTATKLLLVPQRGRCPGLFQLANRFGVTFGPSCIPAQMLE